MPNDETQPRPRAFDLVADDATRLLILGSLPGERSLAERRYYAHPGNGFWRLLSPVVGRDLVALPYADRLAALLAHGIGVWDVVAEADRAGSLDSAIRAASLRDLAGVAATLPSLTTIAFNGRTAERLGLRQLGEAAARFRIVTLVSSSGACGRVAGVKEGDWARLATCLA